MEPIFRQVYSLLPILLHHHHPQMPGYFEGKVPYGISFYMVDDDQLRHLQSIGLKPNLDNSAYSDNGMPIIGVYSMGSTSSIGQSRSSDLDVWVCHQTWLDIEGRLALQKKCRLLEKWCASIGIEVSFFLIDENHFRYKTNSNLVGENFGSTQHVLLLDEFYRTAVRMAGKRILWNIVPSEEEDHYDDYVLLLYSQGTIIPNEWFDLGGLSSFSAKEYFDAILWQIQNSIDSPYKAMLKTLLLESYSWKYPYTRLLAMDVKKRMHDGKIVSFGLDSYCMMLERVTQYLISIEDYERLDLARRCFYMKVCEKLSLGKNLKRSCWRREILTKLVNQWGWNKTRLAILDSCLEWKTGHIQAVHNELLNAMTESYRNLIRFAFRNNLSISTNLKNIDVLIHQLCIAFEVFSNNVTLMNTRIEPHISRSNLTCVHAITEKY